MLVLGQLRFVYVSQEQREPPNYFEMVADCNRFIHSVDLAQRTVLFLDIAGTETCREKCECQHCLISTRLRWLPAPTYERCAWLGPSNIVCRYCPS